MTISILMSGNSKPANVCLHFTEHVAYYTSLLCSYSHSMHPNKFRPNLGEARQMQLNIFESNDML